MNYKEIKNAKGEILRIALDHNAVTDTAEGKQKYWERLINQLAINFNYEKPLSESTDARRMRKVR